MFPCPWMGPELGEEEDGVASVDVREQGWRRGQCDGTVAAGHPGLNMDAMLQNMECVP